MIRIVERQARQDRGVVIVFVAVALAMIFAFAALAVDTAQHVNDRQLTSDTLDVAAHTGAQLLDDTIDEDRLNGLIRAAAGRNDPSPAFDPDDLVIKYYCVVAVDGGEAEAEAAAASGACRGAGDWEPSAGRYWYQECTPGAPGQKCNTVQVFGGKDVPYRFAPVIGHEQGQTGTLVSTACKAPCGEVPREPLDIAIVVDRTQSMCAPRAREDCTGSGRINHVQAVHSALHGTLDILDADLHRVALGTIHKAAGEKDCKSASGVSDGVWFPIELTDEFASGTAIRDCADDLPTNLTSFIHAGRGHTDFAGPMAAAQAALTPGRPGAKKVIIFMTDGEANLPGSNPCQAGVLAAEKAKGVGIEVMTVAFRLTGSNRCSFDDETPLASEVLQEMASSEDHYFPAFDAASLREAFFQAISMANPDIRLIRLPTA